jgi:diguanylate cyclase (GGDEF)-like protein
MIPENTVRKKSCLEFISEIAHTLATSSNYERVFHLVVYWLSHMYKSQTVAIVLINPKTEFLTVYNSTGLSHTFCSNFKRPQSTGILGKLLWSGTPILIDDSTMENSQSAEVMLEHSFGSCVCVQIAIDHRTLGYLHIDSTEVQWFREEDVPIIRTFADLAAIAYSRCQIQEENLKLDRIDHETDTEKYGPFIENVRHVLARAQRTSEEFSLLLMDVDNIKMVMNTYGRDSAFQLLHELASLIKTESIPLYAVGRYGFDEFIVLLDHCGLHAAVDYATSLLLKIERKEFTANNLATTVSIGIASYPQNAVMLEELLITLKNALFEAQRAGKNKVHYYQKEWFARITHDENLGPPSELHNTN